MSSIQSRNLFLFVGFLYRLLGNGIWPVRVVRLRCSTNKSKRCYGNNNVQVKPLLDIYCIYLFSVTEKKPTDPLIIEAVIVSFQNLSNFSMSQVVLFTPPTFILTRFL